MLQIYLLHHPLSVFVGLLFLVMAAIPIFLYMLHPFFFSRADIAGIHWGISRLYLVFDGKQCPYVCIEFTWEHERLKMPAVSPFTFTPLPLGSIAPLGWMNDQLQLMADGLAGHEKDFYHFVNDSTWLGGASEYSGLNEGFPYWFNGAVPLAYALNDERLIGQVHDSIDYVLAHQHADGWLGPETTNATRDLWARFPLFLGFTQVMEAEQGQAQRLLPAMYRFINLMHSMLVANQGFIEFWGQVRYQDMLIALQWLHENAPSNDSQLLFDTMDLLRQRGRDWADYYQQGTYIIKDLDLVQPAIGGDSYTYPWVHGVNVAQCKFTA